MSYETPHDEQTVDESLKVLKTLSFERVNKGGIM